jgi:hypothetical protein
MNEDHLRPEVAPIVPESGLRRRSINLLPCSVRFHVVFRDEHHDTFCVGPSTLTNNQPGTVTSLRAYIPWLRIEKKIFRAARCGCRLEVRMVACA